MQENMRREKYKVGIRGVSSKAYDIVNSNYEGSQRAVNLQNEEADR